MANRRIMGGMGNRGGNRPFSQQPFQGNLNPWQGNMSNNFGDGLMNQLSNPQQLALALTSLLQPQQQSMNNPPSLLSLNATPAFNQDRDLGQFGNRGRSLFRRPEPYNKQNNRGGNNWRDGNRNNNRNRSQSGGSGNAGNRNNNRNHSTPKKFEEKKKEEKKTNDSIDLSIDEEDVKKRDWKEEKNKSDDKEETTVKDDNENEDDKTVKEREGRYSGIPKHLLHCFVCSKDMWDGESFHKHVRGRAHKQMLDSLEESMGITVGILRENMRLAEEKKMIELNRMQRLNKKPSRKYSDVESHCNMCDFKFLGKIMAHRKSEGHQRLKRFLHPNCNFCDKEFPSRMEWVEHRLSPEHLRSLVKFMEEKVTRGDGAAVYKDDDQELDLQVLMEENTEQEDDFPIVEFDDDLHDLQNRIPAYRKTRQLAAKSLVPFTGFLCEICNTSFTNEDSAKAHLKTMKHYLKFVEGIKNKYQKQLEEEKSKEEEAKSKKDENEEVKKESNEEEKMSDTEENSQEDANDSEMYDPEEACTEEEKDKEDSKPNGDVAKNVKVESETDDNEDKEVPSSPNTQMIRPKRATNVKNGAGPKSKRGKK